MSGVGVDVRLAMRWLLRRPLLAFLAVLSLGLAIAFNATLYSTLDALIDPDLGIRSPERLYRLRYFGDPQKVLGPSGIAAFMARSRRTFEDVTGYERSPAPASLRLGQVLAVGTTAIVRPNFFSTIGARPVEGQLAAPIGTNESVAVISERLSATLFTDGGSPVGRVIDIDGQPVAVIGTVRPSSFGPLNSDVWVLVGAAAGDAIPLNLIRLRENESETAARGELDLIAQQLAVAAGDSVGGTRFHLQMLRRQFRAQRFHYALAGAVVAILLVACANVASLQFARGLGRRTEIATRAALGATRGQIIRLLTAESAVLSVLGLIVGLLLTLWGTRLLESLIPPNVGGYIVAPELSWRTILVAMAAAVVCTVLVGLVPAVQVSRLDLQRVLQSGTGTGGSRPKRRKYGLVIAGQLGLTLPLVIGALLLLRSASQFQSAEFRVRRLYGYEPESLVVARIRIPSPQGQWVKIAPISRDLLTRIEGIRQVSRASIAVEAAPIKSKLAISDPSDGGIREIPAPLWSYFYVTPEYFRTFEIPLAEGRDFEPVAVAPAVIIDRATATYLWPRVTSAGKLIKLGDINSNAYWATVKGVLGDRFDDVGRRRRAWVDTLRLNGVYQVLTDSDSVRAGRKGIHPVLYARVSGDPRQAVAAMQQLLRDLGFADADVRWMPDDLGITDTVSQLTFVGSIFATFGSLCLLLLMLGIYSLASHSIAERRRELAMRVFLGASSSELFRTILREGNFVLLLGIAAGLFLTWRTIGWLGGFLGEEDMTAAPFFAFVSASIFIIAGLAAVYPALRGAHIKPVEALRSD